MKSLRRGVTRRKYLLRVVGGRKIFSRQLIGWREIKRSKNGVYSEWSLGVKKETRRKSDVYAE